MSAEPKVGQKSQASTPDKFLLTTLNSSHFGISPKTHQNIPWRTIKIYSKYVEINIGFPSLRMLLFDRSAYVYRSEQPWGRSHRPYAARQLYRPPADRLARPGDPQGGTTFKVHQRGKNEGREILLAVLVNSSMLEVSMSEKESICYRCSRAFPSHTMKRLSHSEGKYVYFCPQCSQEIFQGMGERREQKVSDSQTKG